MRRSRVRGIWVLAGLAAALVLFLGYAWIDGGREPLRPISQTVPVGAITR